MIATTSHMRPALCFIGPMTGRNGGMVTTQGEIVSDLLREAGYPVVSASSLTNRYLRLADIVRTIVASRGRVDVQCLQVYGGPSFVVEDVASRLARRFGHRLVMFVHGGAMPEFMARYPGWSQRVLRRAHALVVPSPFLARALGQHGLAAHVVPNVIDLSGYPYRHRSQLMPRLLWMRTFHPIYNPELALRAFARIKSRYPSATLVMAGEEKGMAQAIREAAVRLGVAQDVRFAGFLDAEAKAREGALADVFLNTNRIDNMPVSVVEACAMGLPVVATAVGGVPDLLTHEDTGLLVPDDDEAGMASAVLRLLGDAELAARLSQNGRLLAERSAWENVRLLWDAVLTGVMSDRPALREERS